MTDSGQTSGVGQLRQDLLPEFLRALYQVVSPDVVRTLRMMPNTAFFPQTATGNVLGDGGEEMAISGPKAPVVTRVNTNSQGWLLGFRPEQIAAGQITFGIGHAQVSITPSEDGQTLTVSITYANRHAHVLEQMQVGGRIGTYLEGFRVE